MAKTKKDKMRFFELGEEDLMKAVNLTDEEWDFFDALEYSLYKASGKKYISGGYCHIRIFDYEEIPQYKDAPAESIITFYNIYGTEGEGCEKYDSHQYDRINKKVIE